MHKFATADRHAISVDDALVRGARDGDMAAFERLVATRLDRCYRLAWSILSNDADAADALQDGLVSAWRQIPRLRDPSAFDGWLNRVVANAALMARRQRARRREVQVRVLATADDDAARPDVEPVDRPAHGELESIADADAIVRAFQRLTPEQRAILALHHVDGSPVAELARMLGVPVGTAKWRLHEARRALEHAMESES